MRSNVLRVAALRVAALCLLILIGNTRAWSADPPGASGDDPSVWSVDGVVITDTVALGNPPVYFNFGLFGETPPVLAETEAENLCAEIGRTGWDWITRERALDIAPGLAPGIEEAEDAGLLRGFLAVALQDTGCAEPPADVLAEALRYLDRFL
jgi:hypothetical protein